MVLSVLRARCDTGPMAQLSDAPASAAAYHGSRPARAVVHRRAGLAPTPGEGVARSAFTLITSLGLVLVGSAIVTCRRRLVVTAPVPLGGLAVSCGSSPVGTRRALVRVLGPMPCGVGGRSRLCEVLTGPAAALAQPVGHVTQLIESSPCGSCTLGRERAGAARFIHPRPLPADGLPGTVSCLMHREMRQPAR